VAQPRARHDAGGAQAARRRGRRAERRVIADANGAASGAAYSVGPAPDAAAPLCLAMVVAALHEGPRIVSPTNPKKSRRPVLAREAAAEGGTSVRRMRPHLSESPRMILP